MQRLLNYYFFYLVYFTTNLEYALGRGLKLKVFYLATLSFHPALVKEIIQDKGDTKKRHEINQ